MKKRIILFAAAVITLLTVNAQTIIKGDMNGDDKLDVSDVTSIVDCILTNSTSTLDVGASPYQLDQTSLLGTWSKYGISFTFGENGITDYPGASTYEYYPYQGRVLFFDVKGVVVGGLNVYKVTPDYLILGHSYDDMAYWRSGSAKQVELITLSKTSLTLTVGDDETSTLTATVSPADAVITSVVWSSSAPAVATVSATGTVTAVGGGTCTITCTAGDGSGVTATCTVTVRDPLNGHAYVDLGLSSHTLWATCNVGATTPYGVGDYFAWGETKGSKSGKNSFSWSNYKWCNGTEFDLTKYCEADGETTLDASDDAAAANWGGDWRMPTLEEWNELSDEDNFTWIWIGNGDFEFNGVAGYKVMSNIPGYIGNYIFLPVSGYYVGERCDDTDYGCYWTSTIGGAFPDSAWSFRFTTGSRNQGGESRAYGLVVRPVIKLQE